MPHVCSAKSRVLQLTVTNRNNYPAARLQGLQEDLGLTDSQYQVGLSILFVGYILAQVPSNMLLNYIGRPSLYLGGFTVAWGLVSALTCLAKGYGSIVACRFFLGFVGKCLRKENLLARHATGLRSEQVCQ